MRKIYSTLLLVMAMLCIGANSASAQEGTVTLYIGGEVITDFPRTINLIAESNTICLEYNVDGENPYYYNPEGDIERGDISNTDTEANFTQDHQNASLIRDIEGEYTFTLGDITYDDETGLPTNIPMTVTFPKAYSVTINIEDGQGGILVDKSDKDLDYREEYKFIFAVGVEHKLFAIPNNESHFVKWTSNGNKVTEGLGVDDRGCHYLQVPNAESGEELYYTAVLGTNHIVKNVAQGKYGTIILPYAWEVPDGWKAYSCHGTEGEEDSKVVILTPVESPQANTPYIVKNIEGEESEILYCNEWINCGKSSVTEGFLTGVLTDDEDDAKIPNGSYVLATNKSEGTQAFYLTDGSVTCPQYKCYLTLAAGGEAKVINIVVEDEADGIKAVNSEQLTVNNGKFLENGRVVIVKNGKKFNLNGQEVK